MGHNEAGVQKKQKQKTQARQATEPELRERISQAVQIEDYQAAAEAKQLLVKLHQEHQHQAAASVTAAAAVSPPPAPVPTAVPRGKKRPAQQDAPVAAAPRPAPGPAPAASTSTDEPHPFDTDSADHAETPVEAYRDVAPLMAAVAASLGRSSAGLRIWDPYFCAGSMKQRLGSLGFSDVHNVNEDFYAVTRESRCPPYDLLLTNPPYSADHMER